jgi:Raf kinase inhibitor-like YbhB/YbcL family protein
MVIEAVARWYHLGRWSYTMRRHRYPSSILISALLMISPGCTRSGSLGQADAPAPVQPAHRDSQGERAMPFTVKSTAFPNGGAIPKKYTCDGADLSPELTWEDVPAGTQSLALIADDPDAPMGTWTHWLIWNIPAKATLLPEDTPKVNLLDNGARQGGNDFKRIGYGGPCPPPGKLHRYHFKLYALDTRLEVKAGAVRSELEPAIKTHILSQTQWMGTYGR